MLTNKSSCGNTAIRKQNGGKKSINKNKKNYISKKVEFTKMIHVNDTKWDMQQTVKTTGNLDIS